VWFEKSRAIAKQYQLPYEEMLACSNLGGMYIEEKKYSIAEKNANDLRFYQSSE
jgi:hypothetical protein